ncbi:MAG: phosphotransferase [Anaerolineae bacterium]|nr:phosphotransferase [Anaerolineae bacterium]
MNLTTSTIVLCGGPINYSNLPVSTYQSNAMVPVNGRPVISWILEDLLEKHIQQVTVVIREQDQRLRTFLQRTYSERIDITIAALTHDGTIIESLATGLASSPSSGNVRVLLGDTLIRDPYDMTEDMVYVSEVEDSRRWCLALLDDDGHVLDYADKQELAIEPKLALAGYYHFVDGAYLRTCIEQSISGGEKQLSDVLRRYGIQHPIHARRVAAWYDFGNIDHLVTARRLLLRPRHFNSLHIDPILNTITKVSKNDAKLRDELDWYLMLPDELKVLTPRIVTHHIRDNQLHIVQEYYGYPTLAELYVYGNLHVDNWASILKHVFRIHDIFRQYQGQLRSDEVTTIYLDKTWERLHVLRNQSGFWQRLLDAETVTYNHRTLQNIPILHQAICERAEALALTTQPCIIHGDFCFSNILFDISNQIIRLIDPRGSFGSKGLYGDPRYDIAKLRHSICGLYDYIVADIFTIHEDQGTFEGEVYDAENGHLIQALFDALVVSMGYNLDEIRFIEGLLFISMVPLHSDYPKRQLIMYMTGLTLLNDTLTHAHLD